MARTESADMTQSIHRDRSRDGIEKTAHVLMIPHAALPHLTPMVHLAQQLVSRGGVTCTVLGYDHLIDQVVQDGLHPSVHLLGLTKNLTGYSPLPGWLPPDVNSEELRCTTEVYIQELLRKKAAAEEGPDYTCVISDFILHWTIDTASSLGCFRYILVPYSAYSTLIIASVQLLVVTVEPTDLKWEDSWLADSSMPKQNITLQWAARPVVKCLRKSLIDAKRVLINTFYELESRPIDYLRDMGHNVTTVGPLQSSFQVSKVSFENTKYVDEECLQWLDKQPAKSVVYVNFGTTGFNFFNLQMVHELALGLEASQARFLWVLRPPPRLTADELDQLLPSGLEERVKDRALISRGWAPQLKILEHPSTAAFFMQCGWNSVTESLGRGIPFIGWATYADQPFNARYAAEGAKVGLLLPHGEKDVDKHDVEAAVRTMMFSETGLVIKKRAEEMKTAASNAVKPGGLSHSGLMECIDAIVNRTP